MLRCAVILPGFLYRQATSQNRAAYRVISTTAATTTITGLYQVCSDTGRAICLEPALVRYLYSFGQFTAPQVTSGCIWLGFVPTSGMAA
jgi:hypothetical protein